MLGHFLNDTNQKKESRKNAEILVNSVKSDLFGHSKRQNSVVFEDSDLKFRSHIHQQVLICIHCIFLEFSEISKNNECFSQLSKLKIKILYCNFIATFNLHALVKINEFYLLKLNS